MCEDTVEDVNHDEQTHSPQDSQSPSSLLHNHFILQVRVNDLRVRKKRHLELVNMFVNRNVLPTHLVLYIFKYVGYERVGEFTLNTTHHNSHTAGYRLQ
jgi:hypothetical protein